MSLASVTTARLVPCQSVDAFDPTLGHACTDVVRGDCAFELDFRHAGRRRIRARYEWLGPQGAPVVLVAGGISAGRHVAASGAFPEAGWWQAQVGAGRAIDTRTCHVLAIDWIGADGDFDAVIDPADQADAFAQVLDVLGITRLEALVGASYGAMVGLQFAARHASRLKQLVAISGTHRAHPYSSAWRALQRQIVALGALQCDEGHGLSLARQLAILGYRTPEEFNQRFAPVGVVNGRVRAGAEDYLDHCGARYAAKTPPSAFLRLSESIDLHSVEPEAIRIPVTVIAVAEDRLVPVEDARVLVARLGSAAHLHVLHSKYGHDAFLKEENAIAAIVSATLASSYPEIAA